MNSETNTETKNNLNNLSMCEEEPLQSMFDAMKNKNVKLTFGLQPDHLKAIETELQRWRDMPPTTDGDKANPKYIKYVWDKLGKELGWCPFTLALYYFEYLEESEVNYGELLPYHTTGKMKEGWTATINFDLRSVYIGSQIKPIYSTYTVFECKTENEARKLLYEHLKPLKQ